MSPSTHYIIAPSLNIVIIAPTDSFHQEANEEVVYYGSEKIDWADVLRHGQYLLVMSV
jgi:hypothetical protein